MTSSPRRGGRPRPLRSLLSLVAATAIATAGLAAVTIAPSAAAVASFTGSNTPATIPFDDAVEVPFVVTGSPSTSNIEISMTISHPCIKEVSAVLIAPAGGSVRATVFSPDNLGPCTNSSTTTTLTFVEDSLRAPGSYNGSYANPTTETYLPVGSFNQAFGNTPSNGTWLLQLSDNEFSGQGSITAATLKFTSSDPVVAPPSVQIDGGPANGDTVDVPTFTFSSPDSNAAGFECFVFPGGISRPSAARVSGINDWSSCTSPVSLYLTDGDWGFGVRAVDGTGDPGSAIYIGFTVVRQDAPAADPGGPVVSIVSGPEDGATVDTAPTYGFTTPADDFAGFECTVDGAFLPSCTNPMTLTGLEPGTHVFGVRGVDADGNRGSLTTRTFTLTEPAPSQACTDAQAAYDAAVAKVADLRERIKTAKAQGKDAKVKRLKAKLATAKTERDAAETRIETDC